MLPASLRLAGVLLLLVGAVACAKPLARTRPEAPPLDAPPPPPRVIAPVETEAAVPEGQTDAAPGRAAPRPGRSAASRGDASRADAAAAKSEPKKTDSNTSKVEPGAQGSRSPVADEAPAPGPLQTAPPGADVEAERKIRQVLARAGRDLSRVDYNSLNTDARAQYDTAKRFIEQADEALKGKNFVFANQLADKAATLAGILLGR